MRTSACLLFGVSMLLRVAPAMCQSGDAVEQIRKAEAAFARTMADRDIDAFRTFLAGDAVFVGDTGILRGPQAIREGWNRFFTGEKAPFSWEPETIAVLESGDLALSSGPVYDPNGKRVGTFNSVWRREPDRQWKVVFDKGCPPCNCEPESDSE